MITITAMLIVEIVLAVAIAVLIRVKDTPAEPLKMELVEAGMRAVYALVAIGVALIYSDSQGIDLTGWAGLVILVPAGVGGMAFVRTILNVIVPPEPAVPPKP